GNTPRRRNRVAGRSRSRMANEQRLAAEKTRAEGASPAGAGDESPGGQDDGVAALLIAVAEAVLGSASSPLPKSFVTGLFARAVPEDVVRYNAREVADLAESAWAFMAERQPGAPKVRFEQPTTTGERLKTVSVLEIVNDDMPFLVDSVLGAL